MVILILIMAIHPLMIDRQNQNGEDLVEVMAVKGAGKRNRIHQYGYEIH